MQQKGMAIPRPPLLRQNRHLTHTGRLKLHELQDRREEEGDRDGRQKVHDRERLRHGGRELWLLLHLQDHHAVLGGRHAPDTEKFMNKDWSVLFFFHAVKLAFYSFMLLQKRQSSLERGGAACLRV